MQQYSLFRPLGSLVVMAALSGCAALGGPFCKSDHDDPKVAALMKDSCSGDRAASMHLGLWFEAHEDYKQAARYYGAAAAPSGGGTYIYVPPAGNVAGYVMPVDTGPRIPGNAEAMYRLGLLYQKGLGVTQNNRKAKRYFTQATELGHADAAMALAAINRSPR